jgi:AcrR family transcriptional regulator
MTIYKKSAVRIEEIIAAGLALAAAKGYQQVSRADLAEAVGVVESNVSRHFGTMKQFRRSLMRAAVNQRNLAVLAQGLAMRDAVACEAPADLRAEAANSIKA